MVTSGAAEHGATLLRRRRRRMRGVDARAARPGLLSALVSPGRWAGRRCGSSAVGGGRFSRGDLRPYDGAMRILRLDPGDEALLLAGAELFDAPPTETLAARFLSSEGHHLLVAVGEAGDPVGFVSGVETTHPDKGTEMFLYELSVAEAHRNQGIGAALVRSLAELAHSRGCYGIVGGHRARQCRRTRYLSRCRRGSTRVVRDARMEVRRNGTRGARDRHSRIAVRVSGRAGRGMTDRCRGFASIRIVRVPRGSASRSSRSRERSTRPGRSRLPSGRAKRVIESCARRPPTGSRSSARSSHGPTRDWGTGCGLDGSTCCTCMQASPGRATRPFSRDGEPVSRRSSGPSIYRTSSRLLTNARGTGPWSGSSTG